MTRNGRCPDALVSRLPVRSILDSAVKVEDVVPRILPIDETRSKTIRFPFDGPIAEGTYVGIAVYWFKVTSNLYYFKRRMDDFRLYYFQQLIVVFIYLYE